MNEKFAVTRAGQRLRVTENVIEGGWIGALPGYPANAKAGWSGRTKWNWEGRHCLCRCDDLVNISDKPFPWID